MTGHCSMELPWESLSEVHGISMGYPRSLPGTRKEGPSLAPFLSRVFQERLPYPGDWESMAVCLWEGPYSPISPLSRGWMSVW